MQNFQVQQHWKMASSWNNTLKEQLPKSSRMSTQTIEKWISVINWFVIAHSNEQYSTMLNKSPIIKHQEAGRPPHIHPTLPSNSIQVWSQQCLRSPRKMWGGVITVWAVCLLPTALGPRLFQMEDEQSWQTTITSSLHDLSQGGLQSGFPQPRKILLPISFDLEPAGARSTDVPSPHQVRFSVS